MQATSARPSSSNLTPAAVAPPAVQPASKRAVAIKNSFTVWFSLADQCAGGEAESDDQHQCGGAERGEVGQFAESGGDREVLQAVAHLDQEQSGEGEHGGHARAVGEH